MGQLFPELVRRVVLEQWQLVLATNQKLTLVKHMDYGLNRVGVVLDLLPSSSVILADCVHDERLIVCSESLKFEVLVHVLEFISAADRLFVVGLHVPSKFNLVFDRSFDSVDARIVDGQPGETGNTDPEPSSLWVVVQKHLWVEKLLIQRLCLCVVATGLLLNDLASSQI